jgi:hypothetical protein
MRVCHPGPVAFHFSIISGAKRNVINCLGFASFGRPPLLITPLAKASSVNSGKSSYSSAWITCESIAARRLFKEGLDTLFFTVICLSHTEYMTVFASRRITNYNHPILKKTITNHSALTILFSKIVKLEGRALKHYGAVFEVQLPFFKRREPFTWIKFNFHTVIVATLTIIRQGSKLDFFGEDQVVLAHLTTKLIGKFARTRSA